jgi:hypothetical protein
MHTATWLALQDELEKIAGPMEDAHADYLAMMKKHMHNPQVVARMHPTERVAVFKHLNSPKNAGIGGKIVAKAGNAVATLAKHGGLGAGALDMAGLGLLAAPTVQHMRGKPMSDKNKNRAELGGLGVLGASVAAEHGKEGLEAAKSGLSKLKGLVSKMPKHAGLPAALRDFKNLPKNLDHATVDRVFAHRRGSQASELLSKAFDTKNKTTRKTIFNKAMDRIDAGKSYKKSKKGFESKKKTAGPSMGAMMNMHRLAEGAKAAKNVAAPMAQAAVKLPNAAQQAGRAAHLGQHMAQGGHAFNPATRKTLSIPGLTD